MSGQASVCSAVYFSAPTVPFFAGVPVRCTKPSAHDEWHSGSGRDLDGEPFGAAWRAQPALPAALSAHTTEGDPT